MATLPNITCSLLRQLLSYDPETGVFIWRQRPHALQNWNTRYAGKVCGYDWSPDGKLFYRSIRIFDWPFLGHRLAVLYMTGRWPKEVDHRNGNGLDNRWKNLRLASKSQNGANRGASKNNKLGIKGVSADRCGRFRATLCKNGKQIWLGYHSTPKAASKAYAKGARKHFGDFARHK